MASRSPRKKYVEDSDEEESYEEENDHDISVQTSRVSNTSFSTSRLDSTAQLSDGSFSSPSSSRRRYLSANSSQSSKSPGTPKKLYPDIGDHTPSSPSLYPDLKQELLSSSILKKSEEKTNLAVILMIACILIGLLLCLFISSNKNIDSVFEDSNDLTFKTFVQNIDELKEDFPSQTRRTWKILQSTAKHVLNRPEPIYPSIVLMSSEMGNSDLTSCLANKISEKFKASTGDRTSVFTTDIKSYSHLDSAEQKIRLDEAFLQAFQRGRSKSILVENLQLLSGEAALLLYKYCDNDNAPYKDVLILLTIYGPTGDANMSGNIEEYLGSIWRKSIDPDKVEALMSRVANNIVVVNQETKQTLSEKC